MSTLTAHLPAKLAALFFSLVLWLAVGAEEPTDEWVDVRLALALDSTVALRGPAPRVQALVVGRARELFKLYTEPPVIRHVITADTPDQITLELHPEDVILPSNVTARVTDVRPRAVPISLLVADVRRVPVHPVLQVTADSGILIIGPAEVAPESVTVYGPRAAVRGLGSVDTERATIVVHDPNGSYLVRLDTTGLGLRVTPAEVHVRIPAVRDTTPPAPLAESPAAPAPRDSPPPQPRGARRP